MTGTVVDLFEPIQAQEVAQLIGMAASLDNRIPQSDPHMLAMWIAVLPRVPFEAAKQAVLEWYRSERYRETRESITPADIAGWWRDRRRHAERDRPQPEFDPERVHRGVDQVLAALAAAKGMPADVAEGETAWRRLVQAEPCEWCRAGAGSRCTGPGGKPLARRLAHDCREVAARARAASA